MADCSSSSPAAPQAALAERSLRSFDGLRSVCPLMHKLFDQLDALAQSDAPVLFLGESGTGKHRAALALHRASARRARPLVTLVCTAVSAAQLDAWLGGPTELSGRTNASPLRKARAGTLILRELAALDLPAQGVLLRALQNEPSLELNPRRAAKRVRLISTSALDLAKHVKQGHFRADLYYRLVAAQVQVLPLRERPADIALLAHEALLQAARAQGRAVPRLDSQALELLAGYGWPGNLRELFNVLGQAVLRLRGRPELRSADLAGLLYAVAAPAHIEIPIGSTLAEAERQVILQTLAAHGCIRQTTAEALGISRRTLYEKLALYKKQGTYWLPRHGQSLGTTSPAVDQEGAGGEIAPSEPTPSARLSPTAQGTPSGSMP